MMDQSKSGQQIGQDNVTKVQNWITERNQLRDWDDYESRGRINRKKLAEELDFARSVTVQNPEVRKLLEKQDKIWFNVEPVTKAAQEASIERSQVKLQVSTAENNKLLAQIATLEAQVRDLERRLAAANRMKSLLNDGNSGFNL